MQEPGRGSTATTVWGPLAPRSTPHLAQTRPDGHRPHQFSEKQQAGGPPLMGWAPRRHAARPGHTHRAADRHMRTESRDSFIALWGVSGHVLALCDGGEGARGAPVAQAGALPCAW